MEQVWIEDGDIVLTGHQLEYFEQLIEFRNKHKDLWEKDFPSNYKKK